MQNSQARLPPALVGCLETLERCAVVLRGLSDADHMRQPPRHDSVGAHMRHCIEFFRTFFAGIATGRIDYDRRERDQRLQSSRAACLQEVERLTDQCRKLGKFDMSAPIEVSETLSSARPSGPVATTPEREILFLSQHTIHHVAIMIVIADLLGFEIDLDLVVAYSTGAYRESLPR